MFRLVRFEWYQRLFFLQYVIYILPSVLEYFFFISAWTMDRPNRIMLGFTTRNTFQVRMPMGDSNSTLLHLMVRVRNVFDCVTEMNMSSISVLSDTDSITDFITAVQLTYNNTRNNSRITSNPFIQILYGSGYENDICQWLISLSQILNHKAKQDLLNSIASMF